ncbi:ferredoxin, partial [Actinomycetota bacterium]
MSETQLMVWIDQDLCTGDGICEEIAPDVFQGRD